MNDIFEYFQLMFSTEDWPPRWFCGRWSPFHGWLTIISDLVIWLAYFFIPVILIKMTQSVRNIPFMPVFWLFGAFIIMCGFTHLIDAVIFYWPAYRFSTLIKFITAVVSMATVFALLKSLPAMINFQSPESNREKEAFKTEMEEVRRNLAEKQKELLQKENEIDRLHLEIAQLKNNM